MFKYSDIKKVSNSIWFKQTEFSFISITNSIWWICCVSSGYEQREENVQADIQYSSTVFWNTDVNSGF